MKKRKTTKLHLIMMLLLYFMTMWLISYDRMVLIQLWLSVMTIYIKNLSKLWLSVGPNQQVYNLNTIKTASNCSQKKKNDPNNNFNIELSSFIQ